MKMKTQMSKEERRPIIIIGVMLVLLMFIANAGAIGLGVVPSRLSVTDALRGEEYEQVIIVHNTDVMTTTFRPYAEGELSNWISYYDEEGNELTNITIAGKNSTRILLKFKIPVDAPSGNYNSTVYVENVPGSAAHGGVGAQMLIRMPVDVTIVVTGKQILTGVVNGITLQDTEIEYPLRIKTMFRNTGNVVATPVIAVTISKDGAVIDKSSKAEKAVKPRTMEEIPVEWDTKGQAVGDYLADVKVSLDGNVLYEREQPFKVLEKGTLTRKGVLATLSYEGEPAVGEMIKTIATFKNTGKIDTNAKFTGEVHRNGKLIETIESDEFEVPVRETTTLTSYLKLDKPGNYRITGYAVYEGKKTDSKELQLEVQGVEEKKGLPAIGVVGALIAFFCAVLILSRRKEVKKWKK